MVFSCGAYYFTFIFTPASYGDLVWNDLSGYLLLLLLVFSKNSFFSDRLVGSSSPPPPPPPPCGHERIYLLGEGVGWLLAVGAHSQKTACFTSIGTTVTIAVIMTYNCDQVQQSSSAFYFLGQGICVLLFGVGGGGGGGVSQSAVSHF